MSDIFNLIALLAALLIAVVTGVAFSIEFSEIQEATTRWASNTTKGWLSTTIGIPSDGNTSVNQYYHHLASDICGRGADHSCLINDDVKAASPPVDKWTSKFDQCEKLYGSGDGLCSAEPGCCLMLLAVIARNKAGGYLVRECYIALSQLFLTLLLALLTQIYIYLVPSHWALAEVTRWILSASCTLLALGIISTFNCLDYLKWTKFADPDILVTERSIHQFATGIMRMYLLAGLTSAAILLSFATSFKHYMIRTEILRLYEEVPTSLDIEKFASWSSEEIIDMIKQTSMFKDFVQYADKFKEHKITGTAFIHLDREVLQDMHIGVADRLPFLNAINRYIAFVQQLPGCTSLHDLKKQRAEHIIMT